MIIRYIYIYTNRHTTLALVLNSYDYKCTYDTSNMDDNKKVTEIKCPSRQKDANKS